MENENKSLEEVETVEKIKKITNRGKTPAQTSNLEKGRLKRAENIALNKQAKILDAKKALLSTDKEFIDFQKSKNSPELKTKLTKSITPVEPDSSSSDEELIIKRIKKKPKKVIILDDFNQTTDEDDDDVPPAKINTQTRKFKTTQNKHSIVKISSNEPYNANNFFC
jgi:hypothetical protein